MVRLVVILGASLPRLADLTRRSQVDSSDIVVASDRPDVDHLPVRGYRTSPRVSPRIRVSASAQSAAQAAPLGIIRRARAEHDADQVLFAPDGRVQEIGAANFLLLDDHRVVTPVLDGSFLPGITRDAVLTLAADLGSEVEERVLTVQEVLDRSSSAEAALTGTAAVLAGIASIVHSGAEFKLGDGKMGPNTTRLRAALVAVQRGQAVDHHGWTLQVHL